jgi:N-acetylglucosaminyldiphosphoundecaprenol N-acetyl-beta-D-mannosaminyltransferase
MVMQYPDILARAKTLRVGPLDVLKCREAEFLNLFFACIDEKRGAVFSYAHAHTLASSIKDPIFASAIQQCDICYCDGIGVSVASLLLNRCWIPKVTANSFVEALSRRAGRSLFSVALIGAENGTLVRTVPKFEAWLGRPVALAHDGYLDQGSSTEDLLSDLAAAAPDLIIIGMGQPQQEIFAIALRNRLPSAVLLCVGGLFDYIAGKDFYCPPWMRRIGLEWTVRLASQPRRLWRRYLVEGLWLFAMIISGRVPSLLRRFEHKSSLQN